MASPTESKTDEIDADQLMRLLELELVHKRATWKQSGQRYRSYRTAAFFFLFLLIVGCIAGGYFVFTQVNEQRTNQLPRAAGGR
jgi:hypothetical protein